MINNLIFFLSLSFISLAEFSFLSALAFPCKTFPLVLAGAALLLQIFGKKSGVWWLFFHGLLLDLSGLNPFGQDILAGSIAGLAGFYAAKHLFSNRSLYGLLSCGFIMWLVRAILRSPWVLWQTDSVSSFLKTELWQLISLSVLLFGLFFFTGIIKQRFISFKP